MDAGEVLDEALRSMDDLRSLILPLGFGEVDVREFRSGGVSGGVTAVPTPLTLEGARMDTTRGGVLEAGGGSGVDIYRVEGTAAGAKGPRPHE